jgi:hypothetical protein
MTRQVSIDDPRVLITADELHAMVSEWADGCDKGFEQVVSCAEHYLKQWYGENKFVIEMFSPEAKKCLFDELVEMMEERMADESSDWNYFELSMMDDLFEDLPMIDNPYVPPVIIKEVRVEVIKEVHVHHGESRTEQQNNMRPWASENRQIDVASQTYIEGNDLPNTRWNEKYQ